MVLRTQLQLARHLELPVILHCVRAVGRLIEVLEDTGSLPAGGMVHGFGGPAELTKRFVKLGYSFSSGGMVTREDARRCRKAAQSVPAARLLVESDTPDHAPSGTGEQSEPASIWTTLEVLASLRGTTAQDLARVTAHNARALFRI